ncbi:MAG: hypothetical protein ACI4ED_02850 [Suilimivivens sp.]
MKWWESVNDKAHDFARWVKGWGSKDAQKVDDEGIGWNTNYAYGGELEEENDGRTIDDQNFEQGLVHAEDYEISRGIVNENAVKRVVNYEKISHSPSVKSLIRHIDNYEAAMKRFSVPEKTGTDGEFLQDVAENNGFVMEYMLEIEKYLLRKAEGYAHKSKRYAHIGMACREEAKKIRVQMDLVNKIQEQCFYQCRTGKDLTYAGRRYEEVLKDPNLKVFEAGEVNDTQKFGSGQINSVYKIQDAERENKDRILKVGKQDVELQGAEAEVYERIRMQKKTGGSAKMNTSYRDVAVSMIDKLFNLNAVVDTSFVRSANGSQSSLMDIAAGKSVNSYYSYMGSEEKAQREVNLLYQIMINKPYLENGPDYKPNEKEKREIEGQKQRTALNIGSEKFVQSTFNLATLDYIVGHVDRHTGNYMVSEQGVQGIDNDTAFSLRKATYSSKNKDGFSKYNLMSYKERDAMVVQENKQKEKVAVRGTNAANFELDLILPYVTEQFRSKIMAVSDDAVRGTLRGLIEEDEIEACVDRVKELRKYLGSLRRDKGQIVDSLSEKAAEYSGKAHLAQGSIESANVLSQVRVQSAGFAFERIDNNDSEADYSMAIYSNASFGQESKLMMSYIYKHLGIIKHRPLVFHKLMQRLAKEAQNPEFNLYEELKSGRLDQMTKEIANEVEQEQAAS